jgi:hypothetical protein
MGTEYLNPGANSLGRMTEKPAIKSVPSPTLVLYFILMTMMEQYSSYNKDDVPSVCILCTTAYGA